MSKHAKMKKRLHAFTLSLLPDSAYVTFRRFAIYHEWELHKSIVNDVFHSVLFSSQMKKTCNVCCSRGALGLRSQGDALLLLSFESSELHLSFFTDPTLRKFIKTRQESSSLTHIGPDSFGSRTSSGCYPAGIQSFSDLLTQVRGRIKHPIPNMLQPTAWFLDGHQHLELSCLESLQTVLNSRKLQ